MAEKLVTGGVLSEAEAEAVHRLGLREIAAQVVSTGLDAARFEDRAASALGVAVAVYTKNSSHTRTLSAPVPFAPVAP